MADERTAQLSDAKRALLEKWIRTKPGAPQGIPRRQESGPAPLSVTQARVWVIEQLLPNSPAYHIADGLRLSGALDVAAFRQAVTEIVRRHETLRTAVAMTPAGQPLQVAQPPAEVPVPLVDLSDLPPAEREEQLRLHMEAESKLPFDATTGPLFRLKLFQLAPEEHALVQVFHHMIYDGWSQGIFIRELAQLYTAYRDGRPSPLPELPLQYADYAAWEQQRIHEEPLLSQLAWWKEHLNGRLPVLELPSDFPRPRVATYTGRTLEGRLTPATTEALKAYSLKEGASVFMTLLAAWAALLYRYSGQSEVIIGTPVANRTRVELEQLIGFFSNTLALRIGLSGDPSFGELLGQVKEVALGALGRQELPFETLVEALDVERSMSYSPLYQAGFSLLNTPNEWSGLPGITATSLHVDVGAARCDLWLTTYADGDAMQIALEYSSDLFTEATARRMLDHYCVLLAAAVAEPGRRLSELPLLTEAERQQILVAWNDTADPYPSVSVIHRLVEEQAQRVPDRIAVICGNERLTYAELNRRANQLARYLRRLGVGPDVMVGFCMERTAAMMIALLAVLKAGGAYVPLDPKYPAERLAYMLQDSGAPVLLANRHLLAGLPVPAGVQIACVEDLDLRAEADSDLADGAGPEHLAYVIYTSGSTGKPKGVMIEHRNVANLLFAMQRAPGFTETDVLAGVTSVSFDIAGLEFYLPLITGATLVLVHRETAVDGRLLQALLTEHGVTVMQATPVTWRLLEEVGWQPDGGLKMLIGGEALPKDLAHRLTRFDGELWNMYGPTETTIWSTTWRVPPAAPTMTIGRPISNTTIYLLDEQMQPVPVGVQAELYIGGDGLARGYLGRPDLTTERFVTTEFGRLYWTGDLARYLPDGNIEFLGRADQQVKVHGFRIEAGEVEVALSRHPSVAQAVVAARPDSSGENRLIAYLMAAPGAVLPEPAALTAFLKQTLPDYMLPHLYVTMERFPLTPNGKVDRKNLPAPDGARAERAAAAYVAPRTPTEELLGAIWAEVLKLERVGATANFFESGGHSLLGIRLLIRVREAFGADLPLRSLYEAPTVAEMAALIDRHRGEGDGVNQAAAALPDLVPDPASLGEPFPLTYVQQAYLTGRSGFFELGASGTNFFMEYAVTDGGPAFIARFTRALNRLIARHDTLRTVLLPDGGQRILTDVPAYMLPVDDLREQGEGALQPHRDRMKYAKAELHTWPLFEFRAALLPDGQLRILSRIDALILDGTSNGLLLKELFQLLEAPDCELEPYACSFRDYALAMAALPSTELFAKSRRYWQERVKALPPAPQLPMVVQPGPETPSRAISLADYLLSAAEFEQLKARAAKLALTPSAVVLTALAEVIGARATSPRFTLSVIASYRFPIHPDIVRMVGNFNSITLLAVDGAEGAFTQRARQLQLQLANDLEHMYYPGFLALQDWRRATDGISSTACASPILVNSLIEYSHSAYAARQLDRGGATTPDGTITAVDGHFAIPQIQIEPIFGVEPDGSLASQWYALDALYPEGMVAAMFAALKAQLQRLAHADAAWAEGPAPERRAVEERLCRCFAEILGAESVGVADDFFRLGGDSQGAIRLIAAIEAEFGRRLPLTALVGGATVGHFAALLM